jgi:ADP-ribose pyrophosphatase YjhB (NUDIX family)
VQASNFVDRSFVLPDEKQKIGGSSMQKIRHRLFHLWFLVSRPMTLGVRIIVRNESEEVLLVRHTYVSGWHLPGGGVERSETTIDAAKKELIQETNIKVIGQLKLVSMHANRKASKRDHVAVYECTEWESIGPFSPNREIAEIGFFPLDGLPENTTEGTRARLDEMTGKVPSSPYW